MKRANRGKTVNRPRHRAVVPDYRPLTPNSRRLVEHKSGPATVEAHIAVASIRGSTHRGCLSLLATLRSPSSTSD